MIDAGRHGIVSWLDLSTPDVEDAARFYSELFGWKIETFATQMGAYTIGKVEDFWVAGLMKQPPDMTGMPAAWTTFFTVSPMGDTIASVTDSGGKVLEPPFQIPGGARVAVVEDPTGAMLALIEGPRIRGPYLSNTAGCVCWVELLTRDVAGAEEFYSRIFGWTPLTETARQTNYTMFQLDGENVAGMMAMPKQVPIEAPAHWAVYFAVGDCAAAEAKAASLGGSVLRPTTNFGMGRFAVLADPEGASFQVMELTG